jgi:hypothetical protein
VNERVGHVFEGNLLVADAGVKGPLLRFEQGPKTCGKVTQPMSERVDGNVYVRMEGANEGTKASQPLVSWAPVAGAACQTTFAGLDDFRQAVPGVEAKGKFFSDYRGAVFRSPELRRFELARVPEGVQPLPVPAEVRKLLGWREAGHVPGALP